MFAHIVYTPTKTVKHQTVWGRIWEMTAQDMITKQEGNSLPDRDEHGVLCCSALACQILPKP